MSLVIYHRDFNPDRVVVNGKCKLAKNNPSKRVYVNYGNKKAPLMLSSPKMRLPYGLSDYDPSKFNQPGEIKYYFESSFAGMEGWKDGENKELAQFYQNIHKVDDKLWQAALLNQKDWFGKTTLTDAMRELVLTPSIRKNFDKKGEEYPPTIRQKLMENNNNEEPDTERLHKFDCTVYDKDNKEIAITHADIPKGADARFILQLTGAVITAGKLHPVWKCCQVKLYTAGAAAKLSGPAFFTESDSDDNDFSDDDHADAPAVAIEDAGSVIEDSAAPAVPAVSPEGESESDSDPDAESVVESAPAPVAAAAKKAPAARTRKGAK